MQTITLQKHQVEMKDSLTWGEMEEMQKFMGTNDVSKIEVEKQMAGNYKLLEIFIISIKNTETGEEVKFSPEWMRALDFNDGLKLVNASVGVIKKNP